MVDTVAEGKEMGLLSGLQVLDIADEKASFCSKLLADMGAEVIKIEKPGGDASRWKAPFWGNRVNPEASLSFWYNNTNKRGITLNLESDQGKELFRRLISQADIVVESFPPGYLRELELGYEELSKINSRLILASVTGFGQNGPYQRYKSCDLVASAQGGQMYVCGAPDTPPLKPYGEQSYYVASLFAAVGILVALRERNHSGKGQHIDISTQEAVAATLEHVMVRYFYQNVVSNRQGSVYWNNSCCILDCKDGYILLTFGREWETLVGWLDSEGMAEDLKEEKWHEEEYRRQHLSHILEVLGRWARSHTAEELFELAQLMHFPWAPVSSISEMLNSPQLKERNFFISIDHPEAGLSFIYPGVPYKFSCPALNLRKRAPLTGEDNTYVYHQQLGLSPEELAALSSTNVI